MSSTPRKLAALKNVFGALLMWMLSPPRVLASEGVTAEQTPTNQLHRIQVDVKSNVQGSLAAMRYAFITIGTVKHSFIVPEGYRVDSSHPREVRLISLDQEAFVTVAFEQGCFPNTSESLRAHVQEKYYAATISAESKSCIASGSAPVVDFQWKAHGKVDRCSREGFFPTASGVMKVSLTSSPARFQSVAESYNQLLQTFRTSINGKFDFVVISDRP
jgi:hypothetical protein